MESIGLVVTKSSIGGCGGSVSCKKQRAGQSLTSSFEVADRYQCKVVGSTVGEASNLSGKTCLREGRKHSWLLERSFDDEMPAQGL